MRVHVCVRVRVLSLTSLAKKWSRVGECEGCNFFLVDAACEQKQEIKRGPLYFNGNKSRENRLPRFLPLL